MAWSLDFDVRERYDTRKPGITVPVTMWSGDLSVDVRAKLDCGADSCIFARVWGINLGIDVESGQPKRFSTVTGSFLAFGHEVVMYVHGIKIEATVYFAADDAFQRDVLGLTGFVDRVQLGLIHYAGELYLNRLDSNGE